MNAEDAKVADAVGAVAESIAAAIDIITDRLKAGGRLIYLGAGTSGRLGVLDASECPPTFSSPPELVSGLIAGGHEALTRAIEGAEDDPDRGAHDLQSVSISANDVAVGIAASGRTPYVIGGLRFARSIGAAAIGLSCNADSELEAVADLMISPVVGPEILSGSTRLKAGTATKMVLNMLTTGTMVRLGKTYGNVMVDLRATNTKLTQRARRIVAELAGVDADTADRLLAECDGEVKTAIVVQLRSAIDASFADANMTRRPFAAACLGIAGAGRVVDRQRIEHWAENARLTDILHVVNDALPVLYCANPDGCGIALVSGTGSFAFGRREDGTTARAGGWGYLFDDEGSAYAIAVDGLRAIAKSKDGRIPATSLVEPFLDALGVSRVEDLVSAIYDPAMTRSRIAALCPLVFESQAAGDQVATQIVDSAATSLAELVVAVASRLGLASRTFPLAVAGGVLLHNRCLQDRLQSAVRDAELTTDPVTRVPDPARSQHPDFGMITSKVRGARPDGLPQYVGTQKSPFMTRPGYLGIAHKAFETGNPAKPGYSPKNLTLATGVDNRRLDDRKALVAQFDRFQRDLDLTQSMEGVGQFRQAAFRMLTSRKVADAFDLSKEDPKLRDRYGRHWWGQSCLLARRLAEAGTAVINIDATAPNDTTKHFSWDDHASAFHLDYAQRERLPQMDQALSELINDLHRRGLNRKVVVIACGEFGRTPRVTHAPMNFSKQIGLGRDHWPQAFSALIAGGNLRMGQVVGQTNSKSEYPLHNPVTPQDLLATVYRHLGVDPQKTFDDFSGRPISILPSGKPIAQLV
eukprot:g33007.t1